MYPHWFQAQRSALASSDGGASSAKRARPSLRRLDAFDSAVVDDAVAGDDETRDEGKLKAHLAAPTCTGWSSVGHQKHYGDATERPHGIWVAERKRLGEEAQEDVAFCENTPRYPVEQKLRQPLADTHEVFGITFSPVPMGWPTRRSRKLMACLNMRTTAWVGPPLKDLHASFANFFCSLELTGDVFLLATPEEIADETARLAKLRGFSAPGSSGTGLLKQKLYLPSALDHWKLHEAHRQAKDPSGGPWFGDLEQSPKGGGASTPGPCIPTLLTHWSVHSWTRDGPVLPMEAFQAHGFNVFEKTCKSFPSMMPQALRSLPVHEQKLLCGNGWHLAAVASWILFILAHTVKLDRNVSIVPEKHLLRKGGSMLDMEEEKEEEW